MNFGLATPKGGKEWVWEIDYLNLKSKNPDNLHLVWRRDKINGAHINYTELLLCVGSIVLCLENFKTSCAYYSVRAA